MNAAAYHAGAKAHLSAERAALAGVGVNWDTGANITGIPSQWNVTTPDPDSGPLAQLNTSSSGKSNLWPHAVVAISGITMLPVQVSRYHSFKPGEQD